MDNVFKIIINDYIKTVSELCVNLLDYLGLKDKNELMEYLFMGKGVSELNIRGIEYKFHGAGCDVYYNGRLIVWDFGRRSQWCSIDPWFIARTLKYNKSEFVQYYDGEYVKSKCEEAVKLGEMYVINCKYFLVVPKDDVFKPEFPQEFDCIVIERFQNTWQIPRDKVVDKFIRKATYIHNSIYNNPYKYTLKFVCNGHTVYTIPYDDISYPENAVVLMSDNIISKLEKSNKML